METRSQTQGQPLKKPGAYNPDLYYQEKDQGFGDVGVDQEPDAATKDDPNDPDFQATEEDLKAAEAVAAAEDVALPEPDREDIEGLKPTATAEEAVDQRGEPVPVVEESPEEREAADVGETMAE